MKSNHDVLLCNALQRFLHDTVIEKIPDAPFSLVTRACLARCLIDNLERATSLEDNTGGQAGDLLVVLGVDVGKNGVLALS